MKTGEIAGPLRASRGFVFEVLLARQDPYIPKLEEVKERLLFVQSVETARCLEEKVLLDPRDADVGSILGWGFPPFLGGTISQIDTVGIDRFVATCDRLAQRHGERFSPPRLLRDMAAAKKAFYAA